MEKSATFISRITFRSDLGRDKESYPFNIPVIQNFKEFYFEKAVTFIVGENGSGKSTLIEGFAVAAGFNPEGGSRSFNFHTEESHSQFHNYLQITKSHQQIKTGYFLRAESFYNVATDIDEWDKGFPELPKIIEGYGGISLHQQSHGESFWALIQNRFSMNSLYFLDEPESALSPSRLLALLLRIKDLVEEGCQFIISTHSPLLLGFPDADIFEIEDGHFVKKSWEDCKCVWLSKSFLNNRERMLQELGF